MLIILMLRSGCFGCLELPSQHLTSLKAVLNMPTNGTFFPYERRVPLLIIELEEHEKYRYVIFDIEDPTSVAVEIQKHMKQ
jgi:hypothetical protein